MGETEHLRHRAGVATDICIQCGNCAMVCPHAVIRRATTTSSALAGAPPGSRRRRSPGAASRTCDSRCRLSVEDCTGCELCVEACPARSLEAAGVRAINMEAKAPLLERERRNLEFFDTLPDNQPAGLDASLVRGVQYLTPLFEDSGACAGCGETPYLRLLTQLFGDRLLVANATGCSSIYGGNLPTTPWSVNPQGRGPAWANSLFEDNAEFGLGFRLSLDKHREQAEELLRALEPQLGSVRVREILEARRSRRTTSTRSGNASPSSSAHWKASTIRAPATADARQAPGPQERLDRRRRRLGVRHWLRRSRSRARLGRNVNHPRARHRGVLEHRWAGLESDAARRVAKFAAGGKRAARRIWA